MATELPYEEEYADISPSTAGCNAVEGKSSRTWILPDPVEADDIQTAISEIIGYTDTAVSADGRLSRTMPLADPQFLYWYANNITSIQGYGQGTKEDANTGEPPAVVVPFDAYYLYDQYLIKVDSGPRDYVVMPDENLADLGSGTYYPVDGSAVQTFSYAEEWNRFVDYDFAPRDDYVVNEKMRMVFEIAAASPQPSFNGSPRMYLPNQIFKITWYGVPLRYILSTNSYIKSFRGRINQNDWDGPAGLMKAGSLLYMSYCPKKYTPPIQSFSALTPGVFTPEKLCNVELIFLETSRTSSDAPTVSPSGNKNFVTAGHNLLPFFPDRKFHYAESLTTTLGGFFIPRSPSFFSMPIEMLFTDPDTYTSFTGI